MKKSRIIIIGATAIILAGATAASAVTLRFTDVPEDHVFANAIDWMHVNGLTYGCNEEGDMFCPEDHVTRGQMSAFMKRLVESDLMQAGADGPRGPQGPRGDTGAPGEQGVNGGKGDTGAAGASGATGAPGDQGIQGDPGSQGEKGDQGPQGDKGETGETGTAGATGAQGIQGEKGEKGDQGIQGEKGEKGDQGIQGERGEKGDQGEKGDTGAPGPAGSASIFTRVVGSASASDKGSSKTATATCSAGVAVSGGYQFSGDSLGDLTITANYPTNDTTWSVTAEESTNYPGNGNWAVQAFVICAG